MGLYLVQEGDDWIVVC